ncbi:trypsin-like peptidase domain-containing protein [Halalkalibacterium halodurans]|uniref:S1C family serine protease n=1 Tax=Halalkalibacterium halodurans TaxID=86665 RepID=UPI002E1CEF18|nr:trypsin-like peptidase domain-containing protein [Halalkalibacterium halodurans]MED4084863.1 trypsin-like peptidase domain-containing protein [Halalkalibacterium halodurans]MED4103455.1 trypsin-like peptidase domain-containing protein [Halalkalibacterium halodurans]MED4107769.1 trypsin-like peptidase domain-containing protein [Halalkalibacterium halodurans]MED4123809.1 trypsin-like peptidase domain-containing protein [Halalkalibacterium halodurans]
MGYYDEHVSNRNEKQKGARRGIGISAFIGAILGALLVLFSVPALSGLGWLPYEIDSGAPTEETGQLTEAPNDIETVNYAVNSDVSQAVEKVSDAVVGIVSMTNGSMFSSSEEEEGTGSGVIYKKEGDRAFIVTNEHVISGANQVEVVLTDGSRLPAEVLGSDVFTDLAVLEIDGSDVETVAEFGNSDLLSPGEPAIAIGNPLGLRFSSSVTLGIISATERSIPIDLTGNGQIDWQAEVLQTDAAINPGNSGGALVNIQGQVIGINSMKIAQSAVEGIGFAIPSNLAIPVIEDLEFYGDVQRPQMGVAFRSLSEIPSFHWEETLKLPEDVKGGVVITDVVPMSPAETAGLRQYDVIVELNGEEINDGHELRKFLYTELNIGDEVEVTYYREGKKETTTLTLVEQQSS